MAGRRKYKRYTDEFIAGALLTYDATPNFVKVAKHLKIPESTLRSWDNKRKDLEKMPQGREVDANIYDDKKINFIEMIDSLLIKHLNEASSTLGGASHHEVIGGVKVLFDVKQLLTGGPTENINQRVLVLDFGDTPNDNGNGRTIQD